MNRKRMVDILSRKFKSWIKSIEDEKVRELANKNSFISGGAIVSLLENQKPNDYDIYFKDSETALAVARYYVERWNKHRHGDKSATVTQDEITKRIKVFVQSAGVTGNKDGRNNQKDESKYRPVFLTDNAITLSDDIQLIVRFVGSPEEVHKNFDFVHCTNYFDPHFTSYSSKLELKAEALESIIMKELVYRGSRYPIASILRTKKFLQRGWKVNAGQYLKMVFQLENFNLKDPVVLADQLNGVDLLYMNSIVSQISKDKEENPEINIDSSYLVQVVERVFDGDYDYDARLDDEVDNDIEGDDLFE